MNEPNNTRRAWARWLIAYSLIALLAVSVIGGCASDPGDRSSFSGDHAGHNHGP